MVSSGFVALFAVVAVQAVQGFYLPPYDCGCPLPPPPPCGCLPPPPPPPCVLPPPPPCKPALEVGCCPGPVVEKKFVTQKPVTVPYTYSVPTFSKKCFNAPAGVDKKVIPCNFETAPVCETQTTVIKLPTTDIVTEQQPLCKKTCTTSEYLIQIPIVETTCTSAPLCKKTVKTQENLLTTTAQKTACAKQLCTQNKIIETPLTQTVCQDYRQDVCKTGAKTVLQPEVKKTCVQLPPYKCLKPATDLPITTTPYGAAPFPGYFPGASYFPGAPFAFDAYPSFAAAPAPLYGADFLAAAPAPLPLPAPGPSCACACA